MKILIDVGHGIDTPGKRSPDASRNMTTSPYYFREYKWARDIGAAVCCLLMFEGYDAELIVSEETDVPLKVRTERVNKICRLLGKENVLLVSIHVNAAASDKQWHDARGWCAFTSPGKTKADDLATCMYEVAQKEFLDPNREYYKSFNFGGRQKPIRSDWSDGDPDHEAKFWMLTQTNCPAVLVENFFQDNKEDVAFLKSDKGRGSCIHVISQGIEDYITKYVKAA